MHVDIGIRYMSHPIIINPLYPTRQFHSIPIIDVDDKTTDQNNKYSSLQDPTTRHEQQQYLNIIPCHQHVHSSYNNVHYDLLVYNRCISASTSYNNRRGGTTNLAVERTAFSRVAVDGIVISNAIVVGGSR